ncbi:putative peptidase S08 family protein [Kitasatospora setae KM-6054]|uniref:Putative peptidase S08 family protein n=1 Tax=Kitasatospora setae (strain ATCC 33774 / DSM 43861 / JCM 3304 / KCC A-0304 / NBRC 14216 / KM-6054) TaxID=452652 RepID=E4NHW9_KITSK|nr:type VII secretion-associated serine protease mycosin [Kitasatospora sp. SID7827]BAJ31099.1 putative peptidase S08 family protein [Kitasatospora setae KM-6054]
MRRAGAVLLVLGVVGTTAAGPAWAAPAPTGAAAPGAVVRLDASGDCNFPVQQDVEAKPWALQRVFLDELWNVDGQQAAKQSGKPADLPNQTGQGVVVAVIDTGVDANNPQLAGKVVAGRDFLGENVGKDQQRPEGDSLTDKVGHGTKVAGIIAAAANPKIGFVGLAKDATVLSIRQNDAEGHGSVLTLARAIDEALAKGAKVINISQDVRVEADPAKPAGEERFTDEKQLTAALDRAEKAQVVVVASSGNDGAEGPTYPAFYESVLAVGASDRNNERAGFSQYGDFVDVAAPGVDMLSTVPGHGQCTDNGTSFSAPYVSGVAAILRGMHKDWTAHQIRTVIEQTAQRTEHGRNKYIGWGVVDPVKAVQYTTVPGPSESPHPDAPTKLDALPLVAQPLGLEETQADRDRRTGTFVLGIGALVVAGLAGGAIVTRDMNRRRGREG